MQTIKKSVGGMALPDTRTCKDCPFFDRRSPSVIGGCLDEEGNDTIPDWADDGTCRTNPPRTDGFPTVRSDKDWCSIVRPGIRIEEWNPNTESPCK